MAKYPAWSAANRVRAIRPNAQLHTLAKSYEIRDGGCTMARGETIAGAWNRALDKLSELRA